jgi:uncharacterized protein (DUF1800 family)
MRPFLSPLKASAWDYAKAAHLLNRAGFGEDPGEVEALFRLGPAGAVDFLLDAPDDDALFPRPAWAYPRDIALLNRERKAATDDEMRMMLRKEEQKRDRDNLADLVAWWMLRMRQTPHPLREKMTLFWHGHFATSGRKVKDAYYLWLQNETFRQHALGNFGALARAILRDPAMLIWLDGSKSRRTRPNENFAREMLELFTLGIGNYSESDVQEAARAFTGYRINLTNQSFLFAPRQHDTGEKQFLGRKGRFDGDDIIAILLEQPACAEFITRKLWAYFADSAPDQETVAALANEFVQSGFELRPVLRLLFGSEAFYSKRVMRTQIKSPVQWLVGTAKMLETDLPRSRSMINLLRELGQVPFMPPNVKGWDGGKAWITTSTLLARYNYSGVLATRSVGGAVLAALPEELGSDPKAVVKALSIRLFQSPVDQEKTASFKNFLESKPITDATVAQLLRLMMSTPQFQLN